MVTKLGKDAVDWCHSDVLVSRLTEEMLSIGLIKARLNQIVGQTCWLVELPVECRLDLSKCVAVHRGMGGPGERRKCKRFCFHVFLCFVIDSLKCVAFISNWLLRLTTF